MDNSAEKLQHAFNEAFNKSPAGLACLDHLYSRYFEHTTQPSKAHPIDPYLLAFEAGQRSVVKHILVLRDALSRDALSREQAE